MGDKSGIEWTDATWNPVTGCGKVSQGCKNCYAERVFQRPYPGREFTDVRIHPDRLDQPLHWKKPRRIFVNSMSDLFHEKVPEHFLRTVFKIMGDAHQHTFQILTKRPDRMKEILSRFEAEGDFPTLSGEGGLFPFLNVWLGVSIENQKTADERVPTLLQTPAAVRFVSYEPALSGIDIARFLGDPQDHWEEKKREMGFVKRHLDWVIAGGESGPHARPSHPDWFRDVMQQCKDAGVPFFMKQITELGRKLPMESWPVDLRVRESPQ